MTVSMANRGSDAKACRPPSSNRATTSGARPDKRDACLSVTTVSPETARGAPLKPGWPAPNRNHSDVPRPTMKELMRRSDIPAIRDTAIWSSALILPGAGGVYFWGSWACVAFFLVYGVLYGSASDAFA